MARVFGMLNGVEVELPHPDVPCAWCGNPNMDTEACPNTKDICTDCCGEDDLDPVSMIEDWAIYVGVGGGEEE